VRGGRKAVEGNLSLVAFAKREVLPVRPKRSEGGSPAPNKKIQDAKHNLGKKI